MRQLDKVLLAVALVAPLLVATLGLPRFFEWVTAPAPRSAPAQAEATATPAPAMAVAAAATPVRPISAAATARAQAAQPTAPVATPEAERVTSAAPTVSTPTAQPTARSAALVVQAATPPTLAPAIQTVAPTTAEVRADAPVAAIARFYALVSSGDFGAAEELWSPRMRSRFPPQENIVQRFSHTDTIGLRRADVVAESQSQATVAADVLETDSHGAIRRFVGRWYLVRGPRGWLLDGPELQAVP